MWGLFGGVGYVESLVDRVSEPWWRVRDMYRVASYSCGVSDDPVTGVAMHHVRSCLGHNVMCEVRGSARLAALHAVVRVGGRWREGEGVIATDHLAMYMYARRALGGRLPSALHNRMVMESCLGVTAPIRAYLDACTNVWV